MASPQSIVEVEALAAKLTRQGVIGGGLSVGQWAQGQVRGLTFCGRVTQVGRNDRGQTSVELKASGWPGGWVWVSGLNVKPCESVGDGRCACARRAQAQAERASARRALSPLGNTGITTVAGARG